MTIMTQPSKHRLRTAADAKAHFSECLRQAEQGPVVLTRHGKRVAALVSIEILEQLERLRAAGPREGLVSVAGGWEGSEEVAERATEYGRSPGRVTVDLD
jgi:prevent-host-death family protein